MIKSIVLLFTVVILISSCTKGDDLKNCNIFKDYEIITIDNCEYIQYGTTHGYLEITHKGNCNNPEHIYKSN